MSNKYRIHEFANRIGRSTATVRRWEREGKLQAKRMPSGHRYFECGVVNFNPKLVKWLP